LDLSSRFEQILREFQPFFCNIFLDIRRFVTGSYGLKDSCEFYHKIACLILRWRRLGALTSPSVMFDVIPSVFQLLLGITVKVYMYDPLLSQFILRHRDELDLPSRSKVFGGSPSTRCFEILYTPADNFSSSRFLPLLPYNHHRAKFLGVDILDEVLSWDKNVKKQFNAPREIPWGISSRPLKFTSKGAPSEDDFYDLDLKSAWETERWVEGDPEDSIDMEDDNSGSVEGNSDESSEEVDEEEGSSDNEKSIASNNVDANPFINTNRIVPVRGKGLMIAKLGYNPFEGESPPQKKQKPSSCLPSDIPSADNLPMEDLDDINLLADTADIILLEDPVDINVLADTTDIVPFEDPADIVLLADKVDIVPFEDPVDIVLLAAFYFFRWIRLSTTFPQGVKFLFFFFF